MSYVLQMGKFVGLTYQYTEKSIGICLIMLSSLWFYKTNTCFYQFVMQLFFFLVRMVPTQF